MAKKITEQYREFSDSSNRTYIVTRYDDGSWACGCMRWTRTFPRVDCKHILRRKRELSAGLPRTLPQETPGPLAEETTIPTAVVKKAAKPEEVAAEYTRRGRPDAF